MHHVNRIFFWLHLDDDFGTHASYHTFILKIAFVSLLWGFSSSDLALNFNSGHRPVLDIGLTGSSMLSRYNAMQTGLTGWWHRSDQFGGKQST